MRFGTIYHNTLKVVEHPVFHAGLVEERNGFKIEAIFLEHGVDNIGWRITECDQLKFNKGWSAELSGWYRTKGVEGQILIQPMGSASMGVSKQILKQKGSLRFNIRDIFYTQYPRGHINFQNTQAYFENRRDSRVANLTFSYRFGKPINDQRQRRKVGGADDEQNRVKVGSGN